MFKMLPRIALLLMIAFMVAACGGKKIYNSPMEAQKDMVAIANAETNAISVKQLKDMLDKKQEFAFYDVRTRKEFAGAYVEGATNVPRGLIEFLLPKLEKDTGKKIVIMCKSGGRGAFAAKRLQDMSYKSVYNLTGGIIAWQKAGYPTAKK